MNKGGFSWKRFIGITRVKQNFARKTGIPTTRSGLERKIGGMLLGKGCLVIIFGLIIFGSLIKFI
jgi:hypothetical protein